MMREPMPSSDSPAHEPEQARQAELDAVREKIAVGIEQAKRGEFRDGEGVFARLDERLRDAEAAE